jgi:hypothetical protein
MAVVSMANSSDGKRDFFVSFNQADRAWATWIAWVLEEAGYSVFFQDWDFTGNFVLEMDRAHQHSYRTLAVLSPDYITSRFTAPLEMDRAHQHSYRTLAVLSPDYITSRFTAPEWAARFAEDATSAHDRLIPVRVQPCTLEGLLSQIVYVDLVGCDEATARDKLIKRVAGIRLKPDEPPRFPGGASHEAVPERPAFPADAWRNVDAAVTPRPGSAARQIHAPPAAWLVGGIAAAALVAVVWLLVSSGDNVTANGGIAAGRDANIGGDVTIGGGPPPGTKTPVPLQGKQQ